MSTPDLTIEQLLDTRHPADVALSPDGGQIAVVVADAASEPGRARRPGCGSARWAGHCAR